MSTEKVDPYETNEGTEMPDKKKAGVAVWEYRNSDEDFDRIVAVSLQGLQDQITEGKLTKEDVPKILYGMEGMFNVLKSNYNLYPKNPEFNNKKPSDFNMLDKKNSTEE